MDVNKLRSYEAIAIIVSVMISHIILNLPNHILTKAGTSTILNILYVIAITCIFFFIISKIFKEFPNSDIIDICEFLGGKVLKILYSILFIIYGSVITALIIRIISQSLSLIYLSNIKLEIIILIFIVASAILNLLGFKTITRVTLILVPFILISMVVIFFTSVGDYVVERALPILGYGIKETFLYGTSNLFAFSSIIILFLLNPYIDSNNFRKIGYISIAIYSIYLAISIISLLFFIPSISQINTILSVYVLARKISLGAFIQRIDAIFILVWSASIFSYSAITLYFGTKVFQKITNIKYSTPIIYSISAIIFGVSIIPQNIAQISFLENALYKYSSLIMVFGISFIILILAYIKKKIIKTEEFKLE